MVVVNGKPLEEATKKLLTSVDLNQLGQQIEKISMPTFGGVKHHQNRKARMTSLAVEMSARGIKDSHIPIMAALNRTVDTIVKVECGQNPDLKEEIVLDRTLNANDLVIGIVSAYVNMD